jgi:hypothetical protein
MLHHDTPPHLLGLFTYCFLLSSYRALRRGKFHRTFLAPSIATMTLDSLQRRLIRDKMSSPGMWYFPFLAQCTKNIGSALVGSLSHFAFTVFGFVWCGQLVWFSSFQHIIVLHSPRISALQQLCYQKRSGAVALQSSSDQLKCDCKLYWRNWVPDGFNDFTSTVPGWPEHNLDILQQSGCFAELPLMRGRTEW